MRIHDTFSGESVTVVKGGALFVANDKPGDALALWPVADKPERLKSWNDRPASARRINAMRDAGFYVETVPAGRGTYAAIAFRSDDQERGRILRRVCLAAVHGMTETGS